MLHHTAQYCTKLHCDKSQWSTLHHKFCFCLIFQLLCKNFDWKTHHTGPHCTTLNKIIPHSTTQKFTAPRFTKLYHTAQNCSKLYYIVAPHSSIPNTTAPHCIILHHTSSCCTTLHHTATHYTTLHHTTPHCTSLHHFYTQHHSVMCNTDFGKRVQIQKRGKWLL